MQDHIIQRKHYASVQRGFYCAGITPGRSFGSNLSGRKPVVGFTASARKRLRRYIRNSECDYRIFCTLTYPPGYGIDGRRCKRDLDAIGKRYARYCINQRHQSKWSMCWFSEWQGNGRLHYHFFGTTTIHWRIVANWWYEIVGSNNPDHLDAGTEVKKLTGGRHRMMVYAAKYASKKEQKIVPKDYTSPGRYWGIIGLRATVEAATTWDEQKNLDRTVCESLYMIDNVINVAVRSGKAAKLVVEVNDRTVPVVVWPVNQDDLRVYIAYYIRLIERC